MIGYGNSMFLATHGILARTASGGGIDPDAQAFITAASITDPTQQSAINTLVTDLKGYNIWTKMKALYPMVGGTAAQHKWNLKDPRDLDAAFRLVFNGGWTHSANGATPNGTNGYADTKLNDNSVMTLNNAHMSYYSRTQSNGTEIEIGAETGANILEIRTSGVTYARSHGSLLSQFNDSDSRAFYIGNRTASNLLNTWRNGIKQNTNTTNQSSAKVNVNYFLGAVNTNGVGTLFSTKQCAFASIGDGLTDTEAANFYTAVQAFQVTLGRSIGTQTVSDADAQAFVTNAGIVDQVEANAVNNLVIGLKADGLWTKMKAVYPFVGGTSTTNKFNLKNPLDTDAAFRLQFNGGWTFSQTGAKPNGTNAYANAFITNSAMSYTSTHLSIYSREDPNLDAIAIGNTTNQYCCILLKGTTAQLRVGINSASLTDGSFTNSRGLFIGSRTSNTLTKGYRNAVSLLTSTSTMANDNTTMYIGAGFRTGVGALLYDSREYAFASIGDGLTDTDATNLNTRVTTFQTALNRNV